MEKQDKISELFRANAHKLEQKPSDAAWSRIEQSLPSSRPISERRSQQRPQARHFNLRPLSIAAGLALLIGLSAAFLWVLNEQDRQYQRALATTSRTLEVEELVLEKEETRPSPIAAQKSLEKAYHPAKNIIDEGTSDQKLVARATSSTPSRLPAHPTAIDSSEADRRTGR